MRNFVFTSLLLALTAGATAANAQAAGRLSVPVSGLRSDEGVVRCGLYAGAATFPKAGQESRRGHRQNQGGTGDLASSMAWKPGTYAVAAFHAANDETQMQYGMFGKPKEGYGFSRNASSSMGAPAFASAAFDFTGAAQSARITLSY